MTQNNQSVPVLYDGDMGSDDLWAIAIMLAHPDKFDVKAITCVRGNVDVAQAGFNVCQFLGYLKHDHIPVYLGADEPFKGPRMLDDGAYNTGGEAGRGTGGVVFPASDKSPEDKEALQAMIEALDASDQPVTIFATGPMTNLAYLSEARPDLISKIDRVLFMGGGLKPPSKFDDGRKGNITYWAEFNIFQDPEALRAVIKAGMPVEMVMMDATQHLVFDEARQAEVLAIGKGFGQKMRDMMMAVEGLDKEKFGMGPFLHDPNVLIYALDASLYKAQDIKISIGYAPETTADIFTKPEQHTPHGELSVAMKKGLEVSAINFMSNPNAVFALMVAAKKNWPRTLTYNINRA